MHGETVKLFYELENMLPSLRQVTSLCYSYSKQTIYLSKSLKISYICAFWLMIKGCVLEIKVKI